MAEEVNLDTIDRGELLERVRTNAAKAAEKLEIKQEALRRLDEQRVRIITDALVDNVEPDVATLDREIAVVVAEINNLRGILEIAHRAADQHLAAEEMEGRRERLAKIRKLLDRRTDLAAKLDKSAKAFGEAERELRAVSNEIWTHMGEFRDASYVATSMSNPERPISAARLAMRRAGATWAHPEPPIFQPNPPGAADVAAKDHAGLVVVLKSKMLPEPETNNA